jgi:hypothetical protein
LRTCACINQTDISFLDREIKQRKQAFGIEIYELMEMLETDESMGVDKKESRIRSAFDSARKDIAVIQAKKDCKLEEIAVMEAEAGGSGSGSTDFQIPPSSGTVLTNEHPSAAAPLS